MDAYSRYGWRKRLGERRYAEKKAKVVTCRRYAEKVRVREER